MDGNITVALGGSILSLFVQVNPFYTAYHIMVLEPKKEMSFNEKLFYCMCIKENAYKYSYGRQANKTLKDIIIPDNVSQWVKENKIRLISSNCNYKKIEWNMQTWKNYAKDYFFDFVKERD